jgi:transposase
MNATGPATDALPLVVDQDDRPAAGPPCEACPWTREIRELRYRVGCLESCFRRSKEREQLLQQENAKLKAEIRSLEQRLYGKKSETQASKGTAASPPENPGDVQRKKRGQQPGKPGPVHRSHPDLPVEHENVELPENQRVCKRCGQPFAVMDKTDDGDILEIDVRAYRRRYHRKRYRPTCHCGVHPNVVSPPPPAKVIPKGHLGISIWVTILLQKYVCFQPLYRLLRDLRSHGLDLSAATVTSGLQKLLPLLAPLYRALAERNRAANHWHGDETRWPIFERLPGKANYYWTLWVFCSQQTIVFVLDPTRCHEVPEDYFGTATGIMNVDRAASYKAMAQVKQGRIVLAFCWAHVRRDFLEVLTGWEVLQSWALDWVDTVAELYRRNDARLAVRDQPTEFAAADQHLREHIKAIEHKRDTQLQQPDLHRDCRTALKSLTKHWQGLTVFVDRPEVPMDNNTAERAHRGPVVGRKNFYGSGAIWSGRLAAILFSLFQTLTLWDLCPRRWLTAYLTACAEAGGHPPPDWQKYLPWRLTEQQKQAWSVPNAKEAKPTENTS